VEQSRRDDLESIGYVLIYFLRGGLPWQGLKAKSASKKYKLIMEKKQNVTITALCSGCPSQFAEYLAYCRSLKFEAKPNIAYLRGMFRDLFRSQGYTSTNSALDWDWNRVDNQGPVKEPGPPGQENDNNNDDVEMIGERNGATKSDRTLQLQWAGQTPRPPSGPTPVEPIVGPPLPPHPTMIPKSNSNSSSSSSNNNKPCRGGFTRLTVAGSRQLHPKISAKTGKVMLRIAAAVEIVQGLPQRVGR